METTGTREEEATMLCRILAMPVKHWLCILVLILLFLALYTVVFAGETGSPRRDLRSGLAAVPNLSQQQCEDIRRVTDSFYDDTAAIRNKIVEKRLELKDLSRVLKTDPYVIDKKGQELSTLKQEFFRKAHETEVDQRKFLTPEQTNKMKNITAGYDFPRFGRKR
jgi:hypothetical protein